MIGAFFSKKARRVRESPRQSSVRKRVWADSSRTGGVGVVERFLCVKREQREEREESREREREESRERERREKREKREEKREERRERREKGEERK